MKPFHWLLAHLLFKMSTQQERTADALNNAKHSNILNIAREERVQQLIQDFLYDSEVESDEYSEEEGNGEEVSALVEPQEIEGASTSAPSNEPLVETLEPSISRSPIPEEGKSDGSDIDEDSDLVTVESNTMFEVGVEVEGLGDPANELAKIRDFRCGCKLKLADGRTGCIYQFSDEEIQLKRLDITDLTNDEKDFYVMGLLNAQGVSETITTLHKKHCRRVPRKRARRIYALDGKPVCIKTFRFMLCLGQSRLEALKLNRLQSRRKPTHGGRKYNVKALSLEDIQRVIGFIENFTEDHGLSLPGRVPGYHRTGLRLLPSYFTKSRLWRTYKQAAEEKGHRSVGITSFKDIWSQHLPNIVVARPMTDLCNICQTNNTRIMRGANITDPNKLALLEAQKEHLHLVNIERQYYNTTVEEAKSTAAAHDLKSLSKNPANSRDIKMGYCFDFAQQVHLPSSPMQPGPIYVLTPRKCGIFGVCCPAIPQQVNFLIDEGMCCGKGSNAVISYLHFLF